MVEKYSRVAVVLHWLVAIGIAFNLWVGLRFDDIPEASLRQAIDLHKSVGLTVLGLVLMRILWRFSHTPPAIPSRYAIWEKRLSHFVHLLLYGLIALVPFSGWLHDSAWKGAPTHPLVLYGSIPFFRLPFFNGMDDPTKDRWHDILGELHEITAWVLLAAVVLHIAGALKHQFLDRDRELQRMWF